MFGWLWPITDCPRIAGRTGRAGKTGIAITFLSNDDDEVMYDLKQGTYFGPTNSLEVKSLTFPCPYCRNIEESCFKGPA